MTEQRRKSYGKIRGLQAGLNLLNVHNADAACRSVRDGPRDYSESAEIREGIQ